jgi:hypothetical protein
VPGLPPIIGGGALRDGRSAATAVPADARVMTNRRAERIAVPNLRCELAANQHPTTRALIRIKTENQQTGRIARGASAPGLDMSWRLKAATA